jgi:Flp pilus assembly protein TadG
MTGAVLHADLHRHRPSFLRRFAGARRAAIAVEFALLAPLLALGVAGLAELEGGTAAGRESPMIASTIGDLPAQTALQTAQVR